MEAIFSLGILLLIVIAVVRNIWKTGNKQVMHNEVDFRLEKDPKEVPAHVYKTIDDPYELEEKKKETEFFDDELEEVEDEFDEPDTINVAVSDEGPLKEARTKKDVIRQAEVMLEDLKKKHPGSPMPYKTLYDFYVSKGDEYKEQADEKLAELRKAESGETEVDTSAISDDEFGDAGEEDEFV